MSRKMFFLGLRTMFNFKMLFRAVVVLIAFAIAGEIFSFGVAYASELKRSGQESLGFVVFMSSIVLGGAVCAVVIFYKEVYEHFVSTRES